MALAKLQITVVHTEESFFVQFNPEEYSFNQENNFASQAVPGLSGPLVQFVAGNATTLDMELFFDTWDSASIAKRDVRDEVKKITNLLRIDRDLHAPPVLDVEWGSLSFRCVLTSAKQQFQMFADDGRPVREWVTTVNAHPDFTLENHGLVHVGYLKNSHAMLLEGTVPYVLTGRDAP